MTTFNSSFDWDNNMPPSISSLDENDFMLLLQKQFPAVNVTPTNLSKDNVDNTNPQSLTTFQLPSTSPLSTDSSPSPPSAHDDNASFNGSDGNNKRASSLEDDHHKRKASASDFDDEINGQPTAKSQHTDSRKKLSPSRRKSTGEKPQDESRLLKRKEQNRAAQRAFRERKEKHVKDLEDKVASLEAKTESQATENENLRDMLSRLQNENIILKQTAFTFSVPTSTNGPTSQPTASTSSRLPSQPLDFFPKNNAAAGPSRVPATAGSSVGTASTRDSPSSIFDSFDSFSALSTHNTHSSAAATPSTNTANTPSSTDMDTMALFGSPGPFTTISSNPMYMSYCDPVQSMNAFASFGGWDSDINMNVASAPTDSTDAGLEELFGEQFPGLIPFGGEFLTGSATDNKLSPSATSASPIGHPKSDSSDGHTKCPKTKEDVERLIASGPKGTFGASPVSGSDGKSPENASSQASAHEYESAFHQALGQPQPPKAKLGDVYNIDELCLEMQRKAKCSIGGPCPGA